MSMARATISGTLVSDPEKRYTPNNTPVTNFTILMSPQANINQPGRAEQPSVIRVVCWRGLAEVVGQQLRKGDVVIVEGRLQMAQSETPGPTGFAKKSFEIDATHVSRAQLDALQPLTTGNAYATAPNTTFSQPLPEPVLATPVAADDSAQQPVASGVAVASGSVRFEDESFITEDDIPF